MDGIKITPELNYKVEINGSTYYPAILDAVSFGKNEKPFLDLNDYIETFFYLPEKDNLVLKSRSIDSKWLQNIKFPNVEIEVPKIFLSRNLAEVLGLCQYAIDKGLVKSINEVEDYKKYFEIFNFKEPEDLFSRFAGTSVFPK